MKKLLAAALIVQSLVFAVTPAQAQDLDEDMDEEFSDEVDAVDDPMELEEIDFDEEFSDMEGDEPLSPEKPPQKPKRQSGAKPKPEPEKQPQTAEIPGLEEDLGEDLMLDDGEESIADEPPSAPEPAEEPVAASEPEPQEEEPIAESEPEPQQDPVAEPEPPSNIYAETMHEPHFDSLLDMAHEERLHRIFLNYQKDPISDDQWDNLIGGRRAETYTIQPGDTLWDISETFFGDGYYWPKLWAENGRLTNPHRIAPGNLIAFVGGDSLSAPSLAVEEEAQQAPTPPPAPALSSPAMLDENLTTSIDLADAEIHNPDPVEIPGPSEPLEPLLRRLPPVFKEQGISRTGNFDSTGLDIGSRPVMERPPVVTLSSYLSDGPPESVGEVAEIEVGDIAAGLMQNVILKMKRPAALNENITIGRVGGRLDNPDGGTIGPVVEVEGVVTVTEILDDTKGLYKGMVVYLVNPVRKGSSALNAPIPQGVFSNVGARSEGVARVVGGEMDESRRVLGTGAIVYLNHGSDVGFQEGDLVAVRATRATRKPETGFPKVTRPAGVLKIVKVMGRTSTAFVVEAFEEIRPGDITGGPLPNGAQPASLNIERASLGDTGGVAGDIDAMSKVEDEFEDDGLDDGADEFDDDLDGEF